MAFDPQQFEAESALGIIPTERLPAAAQDAMEAGYDGPAVVRMAILDPHDGWTIQQSLPNMLSELGLVRVDLNTAALRLAKIRAERILSVADEDPLESVGYFHKLMRASDWCGELIELGYVDDEFYLIQDDLTEQRSVVLGALENILFPEQAEKKKLAREKSWELEREKRKLDWPYVFDSPGRQRLLHQRFFEQLKNARLRISLQMITSTLVGASLGSWKLGFAVGVTLILSLTLIGYGAQYRQLKLERRELLLRQGYPEDKIRRAD